MLLIERLGDVQRFVEEAKISQPLAAHLQRKIINLRDALEPETKLADFELVPQHGLIAILTREDNHDWTQAGLPNELALIMPEWVSRLELKDATSTYYILYVMADNDCVTQVYLPDDILVETIRAWLNEQPMEEEIEAELAGGKCNDGDAAPF